MKNSHNKAIIYDDTCPMCNIYTKAFVQYGFLKSENRLSFTKIDDTIASKLDLHRSKHEIPLIDQDTGEVLYGVDSLVFLLSQKMPWIGKVMKLNFLYLFVKQFYKLVSYNRRTIALSTPKPTTFDCTPDFNVPYRLVFLLIAWVVSVFILLNVNFEMALVFLSVSVGHFVILSFFKRRFEYWGQIATLMFIFSLVLVPSIFFQNYIFQICNLVLAFAVTFWQYYRRMLLLYKYPNIG
jgi:hypothetical protein